MNRCSSSTAPRWRECCASRSKWRPCRNSCEHSCAINHTRGEWVPCVLNTRVFTTEGTECTEGMRSKQSSKLQTVFLRYPSVHSVPSVVNTRLHQALPDQFQSRDAKRFYDFCGMRNPR